MDGFIRIEDYKDGLENILQEYGLSPDNLQLKDTIVDKNNPFRIAKCFKDEKAIWLLKTITYEAKSSAICRIDMRGLADKTDSLRDNWLFLKHTLLHEVCHLLYPNNLEDECDIWAFKEMGL